VSLDHDQNDNTWRSINMTAALRPTKVKEEELLLL